MTGSTPRAFIWAVVFVSIFLILLWQFYRADDPEFIKTHFSVKAEAVKEVFVNYELVESRPYEEKLLITDQRLIGRFVEMVNASSSRSDERFHRRYTTSIANCNIIMNSGAELLLMVGKKNDDPQGYISFIRLSAGRVEYIGSSANQRMADFVFDELLAIASDSTLEKIVR